MTRNVRQKVAMRFVFVVAAAALLAAAQDASAARIYNFTNKSLRVMSLYESEVTLRPGERSPSLQWSNAIIVYHPNAQHRKSEVCYFGENMLSGGNWLKGGNYLLIVQHGTKVSCTVCNAGRKNIAQRSGHVRAGAEYTSTPARPDHGCE
jgi:hypothetical protein